MSPTVSLNDSDAGKPGIVKTVYKMKFQREIERNQWDARNVAFELNRPIVDSDRRIEKTFMQELP